MRKNSSHGLELPKGAIEELVIKNFKSIQDLSIEPGRVNVFIGKPNAGKSNLLEALVLNGIQDSDKTIDKNLIRYSEVSSLFHDHNTNEKIIVSANKSRVELRNTSLDSLYRCTFYGFNTNLGVDKESNSKLSKIGGFRVSSNGVLEGGSEFIRSSKIRKYHFKEIPKQENSDSTQLEVNGNNLWSVVRHNSFLKEFASSFFKEFSLEILFDVRNNKFDIMRKTEDSYYLIDFSMTPDTFQRMLYYLAAIESNKESIILFEEPESQSYPPYIQMLAERIVDDTNNQYFITTHSPFIIEKMLERAGSDKGIKFFVTYFEDYQTKVHELSTKEIDHIVANGVDLFFNIEAFQK